jgi:hypothetical protein
MYVCTQRDGVNRFVNGFKYSRYLPGRDSRARALLTNAVAMASANEIHEETDRSMPRGLGRVGRMREFRR